ncbi:MAG: hypothetical protein H0W97_01915 [Actinobacteria bacterium]|nr:hypothetical protein [Actinomycetota bacterium]
MHEQGDEAFFVGRCSPAPDTKGCTEGIEPFIHEFLETIESRSLQLGAERDVEVLEI